MANDERQSDTFIREVDEELRREQLTTLWKRFAPLVIGVCVLIVVITAGYRGWVWWQARQAAQGGDRFLTAVEAITSGDKAKGDAALQAIEKDGSAGYATLAKLRMAGEAADAGKSKEALAAYDAIAADGKAPESVRSLARIRAAFLALDSGDLDGAKERAKPLDAAGDAWRHLAREVIGLADYRAGDLAAARDVFTEIQQDAETPPDLWGLSSMMVSLIDGQLPVEGETPAPPAGGEAAAPGTPTAETPAAEAPAGAETPKDLPVPEEAPVLPGDSGATAPSDQGAAAPAEGTTPEGTTPEGTTSPTEGAPAEGTQTEGAAPTPPAEGATPPAETTPPAADSTAPAEGAAPVEGTAGETPPAAEAPASGADSGTGEGAAGDQAPDAAAPAERPDFKVLIPPQ